MKKKILKEIWNEEVQKIRDKKKSWPPVLFLKSFTNSSSFFFFFLFWKQARIKPIFKVAFLAGALYLRISFLSFEKRARVPRRGVKGTNCLESQGRREYYDWRQWSLCCVNCRLLASLNIWKLSHH